MNFPSLEVIMESTRDVMLYNNNNTIPAKIAQPTDPDRREITTGSRTIMFNTNT